MFITVSLRESTISVPLELIKQKSIPVHSIWIAQDAANVTSLRRIRPYQAAFLFWPIPKTISSSLYQFHFLMKEVTILWLYF